jgi:hypothetical protein
MCSQERVTDDSELIDEDDEHIGIHNKNHISKGKDLKTIDSINKSIKVKNKHDSLKKNSRNKPQISPVGKINFYDRKSSISLIANPNHCKTKTMAIDQF